MPFSISAKNKTHLVNCSEFTKYVWSTATVQIDASDHVTNCGAQAETKQSHNWILKQFVLTKVHSLDDITAVIKHTPYIFCVDGARKVWIAEMSIVACTRYFLQHQQQQTHFVTLSMEQLCRATSIKFIVKTNNSVFHSYHAHCNLLNFSICTTFHFSPSHSCPSLKHDPTVSVLHCSFYLTSTWDNSSFSFTSHTTVTISYRTHTTWLATYSKTFAKPVT